MYPTANWLCQRSAQTHKHRRMRAHAHTQPLICEVNEKQKAVLHRHTQAQKQKKVSSITTVDRRKNVNLIKKEQLAL